MLNRRAVLALAALSGVAALAPALAADKVRLNPPPPKVPAFIQAAIDNPARSEKQRLRDPARKPGETLALAGLKRGDKVIEIASFGQYYTDILSPAVGPTGHVYMYDLPYLEPRFGEPSKAFVAAHPNTSITVGKFDELDYPKGVDLVTIVLYYHDLLPNKVDTEVFDRKMFDALKPGGKLLIVDHKSDDAGAGWRDAATTHRIGVRTIVEEVTAVGFKLKVDSNLLANPADDHSKVSYSPDERGHTDQALFVFEKPR